MIYVFIGISAFILAILIFLNIPYSPLLGEFKNDQERYVVVTNSNRVIQASDIAHLPEPLQNHFKKCGYIGQPWMETVKIFKSGVPFQQTKDTSMALDFTLFALAEKPVRLAYMTGTMYGIPVEIYDSSYHGTGAMRGNLAKLIPLFNQTGAEMDQGQLFSYLGESVLLPSCMLSDFIHWEPIDEHHVKASIEYNGVDGSGIFTFGQDGLIQSFATNERANIDTNGTIEYPTWYCTYENYAEKSSMLIPSCISASWQYEDDESVYFLADDFSLEYTYGT